jgi:hypothetical protein
MPYLEQDPSGVKSEVDPETENGGDDLPEFRSELHEAAIGYARDGIPVFPCIPNGKKPAVAKGFHAATTDEEVINAWWRRNPNYNIGTEPHKSGWGVIDVEWDGLEKWKKRELENGGHVDTLTNATPSGGLHYWYKGEFPPTARSVFDGDPIDTRGVDSYALLPPSNVLVEKGPFKGEIREYETIEALSR